MSCRPTVAECHKLFPSKWKQTLESTAIPALPFHLSLVQMLFISAFVFDVALCVRPLTPLQTTRGPQRSHCQTRRAGAEAPGLLSASTGWRRMWLSLFSLWLKRGICIPSRLFQDNGYYSGRGNAPRSKAIADRTQVNNNNLPLTPALQTQGIEGPLHGHFCDLTRILCRYKASDPNRSAVSSSLANVIGRWCRACSGLTNIQQFLVFHTFPA